MLPFQWNLTDHHIFNPSLIYPSSLALFSSRALIHIDYILPTNCLCLLSLPSLQLYCELLNAELCLPCSLLGPSLLEWVIECIRHALCVYWINSKDMVVSEGWRIRLKGGSWAYLAHLLKGAGWWLWVTRETAAWLLCAISKPLFPWLWGPQPCFREASCPLGRADHSILEISSSPLRAWDKEDSKAPLPIPCTVDAAQMFVYPLCLSHHRQDFLSVAWQQRCETET